MMAQPERFCNGHGQAQPARYNFGHLVVATSLSASRDKCAEGRTDLERYGLKSYAGEPYCPTCGGAVETQVT